MHEPAKEPMREKPQEGRMDETPMAAPARAPTTTPVASPVAGPVVTPVVTPVVIPFATPFATQVSIPVAIHVAGHRSGAAPWRAYGVRLLSCLLVLVAGACLLLQWSPMSDGGKQSVHAAGIADVAGMPFAPRPSPAVMRERTIAMVLPRPEQDDEIAFRRYLERHHVLARYPQVAFSGKERDRAALIAQVRALRPDLIYAWGTPTTLALAGRQTDPADAPRIRDIPIVFAEVSDPV